MSATYFKAVRLDGASFYDETFVWALEPGTVTKHPQPRVHPATRDAAHYLSVATVATNCTGFSWPCRLLEVEAVADTWAPDLDNLPSKIAGKAFRTVRELPACDVFGPKGTEVVAIIDRARRITADEAKAFAVRAAAWAAAWAAIAWVCKDLIADEHFKTLTAPWYAVVKDEVRA